MTDNSSAGSTGTEEREILVCVTFREFDGGANAGIQERFLEGIRRQTYTKYRLIVTNFREKRVEAALKSSGLPYAFRQSDEDCYVSLTEVIRSALPHLKPGRHIILWTNADNLFEPNLFGEIARQFTPGVGGTSYPHLRYASIEDWKNGRQYDVWHGRAIRSWRALDPNHWAVDMVYLDGDLLLKPQHRELLARYPIHNRWPGQAQTLFLAFLAGKLQNLFFRSKVSVIENARSNEEAVARMEEMEEKYVTEGKDTGERLIRFCEERGFPNRVIPKRHPLAKWHQHRRYRVVGGMDQKLSHALYLWTWFIRHAPALCLWHLRRAKKFLRHWLSPESVLNSRCVFSFVQRILNTHYMNEALKHWLQRHPYDSIKAIRRHEDVHARLGAVQRYPERIRSFGDLTFLFHRSQANFGICLLEFDEAAYLHDLVSSLGADRRIAEIGRFKGGSTFLMACAMGEGAVLDSFDILMHSSFYTGFGEALTADPKEFDAELLAALRRYNLADRVNILVQDSTTVELAPESYDLVFVDGDHSYEGAKKDFLHWKEALKRGGHMLFHDAANTRPLTRCKQGVVTLMGEIGERYAGEFEKVAIIGSLVHFRRNH